MIDSSSRRTLYASIIALMLFAGIALGQNPPPGTYNWDFDTDPLARANQAPGVPEGSLFAGFENNESVSLFSGNLIVSHPASPSYRFDGGGNFQLVRVYNSKNVGYERYLESETAGVSPTLFTNYDGDQAGIACDLPGSSCGGEQEIYATEAVGHSWVGQGWKMHLGRVFEKSVKDTSVANSYITERYLELPDGTEVMFEPIQTATSPVFRVSDLIPSGLECLTYFDVWEATNDCCTGQASGGICEAKICPGEEPCETLGTDWHDEHIEVEFSDGSVWWLEEIAPNFLPNPYGYLFETDRTGWYTTRILDPYRNEITVEYWGQDATPPVGGYRYPEAIRRIYLKGQSELSARLVVETELWSEADLTMTDPGEKEALLVGMLKTFHAMGPDGTMVDYQYTPKQSEYLHGGVQNYSIPILSRVDLPSINGTSVGSIDYEYKYSTIDIFSVNWLTDISYPSGGASEYTYGTYVGALREGNCPAGLPQVEDCEDEWQQLKHNGVIKRTVYPEGNSTGAIKSTWLWERSNTAGAFTTQDPPLFRMTEPNGNYIEVDFVGNAYGHKVSNPLLSNITTYPSSYGLAGREGGAANLRCRWHAASARGNSIPL